MKYLFIALSFAISIGFAQAQQAPKEKKTTSESKVESKKPEEKKDATVSPANSNNSTTPENVAPSSSKPEESKDAKKEGEVTPAPKTAPAKDDKSKSADKKTK